MTKVFVFGNPLIEEDSLALKVAERLKGKVKGIEFVAVQSLDEVEERDFVVLDVAKGIEKVQVIEDLEKLETVHPVSGHDFDLAMELKMLPPTEYPDEDKKKEKPEPPNAGDAKPASGDKAPSAEDEKGADE